MCFTSSHSGRSTNEKGLATHIHVQVKQQWIPAVEKARIHQMNRAVDTKQAWGSGCGQGETRALDIVHCAAVARVDDRTWPGLRLVGSQRLLFNERQRE